MKRVFLMAAISLALSAPTAALASNSHLPAHSTWKLNTAKSDFGGAPAMKSDEFTIITDTDKWLKFTDVEVDEHGKTLRTSWSGAPDGKMHPLTGMPGAKASFDANQDSGHWEMPDGTVIDTQYGPAEDGGKTTTEHHTVKTKDGKVFHQTWVYERVK